MTGHDVGPREEPSPAPRILAVHRYYWPDTPPYASMLRCIAAWWTGAGCSVDIIAGQPSYKAALENPSRPGLERVDEAVVRRLDLPSEAGRPLRRIINGFKLSLFVCWRLLVERYDVVMISTVPPVLGAFLVSLFARVSGTRFIYHCMDIHPEVGRLSGEFANPAVFKLLRAMDSSSCRRASPVVVLSEDMRQALLQRPGSKTLDIEVINNFSLPGNEDDAEALAFNLREAEFTLLFAGNIGRFQGLEVLIEAMVQLRSDERIELLVLGEGIARVQLEKRAKEGRARVRFVGHQPPGVAKAAMRAANAGFVGLVPDVFRYAYPSKTMTYLEQGLPILAAIEPESELGMTIETEEIGVAVAPNDSALIADAIAKLAGDMETTRAMRMRAVAYSESKFSHQVMKQAWVRLIGRGAAA